MSTRTSAALSFDTTSLRAAISALTPKGPARATATRTGVAGVFSTTPSTRATTHDSKGLDAFLTLPFAPMSQQQGDGAPVVEVRGAQGVGGFEARKLAPQPPTYGAPGVDV